MDAFWTWEGWQPLTVASVVIMFLASTWFVMWYLITSGGTWWRLRDGTPNHFGRFLLSRKILLALLALVVLANRLLPEWEQREAMTAILMFGFALQTFVPYRLLMEAQRDWRAQREREARNGQTR